jgi:hypothetical protein
MKRAIIPLLLLTVVLVAQETVRKFVPLKHVSAVSVAELLSVFGQRVVPHESLRMIAISGPPEVIKAMEELIAKVDVPKAAPKNVELTAHLLVGSEQGPSAALPTAIQPVIKQIQSLFTYKSFRLLDTMIARVREAEGNMRYGANASGAIDGPGEGPKGHSQLRVGWVDILPSETERVVRINNLAINVSIPNGYDAKNNVRYLQTGIDTSVDVKEGQKVVVGKANVAGTQDQALIVVLTAKVLD